VEKAALQATANHNYILLKFTVSRFCSNGLYFVVTLGYVRSHEAPSAVKYGLYFVCMVYEGGAAERT